MNDHSPLVSLDNVSVAYDRRYILRDIRFGIRRGDFVAVTGPNGGGKTTLLRVILRLLRPTEGTVEYFAPDGSPTRHLRIGYLPQKSNIDLRFPISVEETVKSGQLRGYFSRRTREDEERFREVAEMTEITGFLGMPVGALSGGQLQRTLLARAIISRPEFLVLDEPLSYVDKHFEKRIYSIMEHIASRCTILLVSHEMSVIAAMASRHVIVDHSIHECSAASHFLHSDCD